jgi:hypothetical protein
VGLQRAGVGEPAAGVSDLGQDPCSGDVGQAGEAGDDLVVGVVRERCGGRFAEALDVAAGGVEQARQGQRLGAHRVFDQGVVP